ncbi:hypothetical protein L7F22_058001 [Adiantum nelumboides]|nr:hypothetical protein [Adiantum nelumboides]
MQQFREAVLKHLILVNDLLSFRKEVIQHTVAGYQRGAIGILLAQQQQAAAMASTGSSSCSNVTAGDLQRCINKLWSMIQEEEVHIVRLVKEVKVRLPESSDLVKYVDGCCDVLANNMYWYTISGQYRLHNVKFMHGQPAGGRPTGASLLMMPRCSSA